MIDDFNYKTELESLAGNVNPDNPTDTFLDKLKEFSMKNYETSDFTRFDEMAKSSLAVSLSQNEKKMRTKVKIISKLANSERNNAKKKSLRDLINKEDMMDIAEKNKRNSINIGPKVIQVMSGTVQKLKTGKKYII